METGHQFDIYFLREEILEKRIIPKGVTLPLRGKVTISVFNLFLKFDFWGTPYSLIKNVPHVY